MRLQVVGTTLCPQCRETVRVFRHSWAVPGRPLAVSLHFLSSGNYCPGTGKRVSPEAVER